MKLFYVSNIARPYNSRKLWIKFLFLKGSKSLSTIDPFQSLLFHFLGMTSLKFITEIHEKVTDL